MDPFPSWWWVAPTILLIAIMGAVMGIGILIGKWFF